MNIKMLLRKIAYPNRYSSDAYISYLNSLGGYNW